VINDINGQEKNDSSGNAEPLFGNPTLALIQSQIAGALFTGAASGRSRILPQLGIGLNSGRHANAECGHAGIDCRIAFGCISVHRQLNLLRSQQRIFIADVCIQRLLLSTVSAAEPDRPRHSAPASPDGSATASVCQSCPNSAETQSRPRIASERRNPACPHSALACRHCSAQYPTA